MPARLEQVGWLRPTVALLLPLATLIAAHLFFLPMYDVNDDPGIDMAARGIGYTLEPSPYLWFPNVLYGQALSSLYELFPGLPWFRLLGLALQWLAGGVVAFTVLRGGLSLSTGVVLATYFLVFDMVFYLHPTFTVTAALLAGAAGLLWLDALVADERMQWPRTALFLALVSISTLIRAESALLILGLALVCGGALLPSGGFSRRLLRNLGPVLAALLLIAGLRAYDRFVYSSTPGWDEFHETHELISEFIDFDRVTYTPQSKTIFDEVGWSANDYLMLVNWFYADEERFSNDTMKRVLAAFPRHRLRLGDGFEHLYFIRNDPYLLMMLGAMLVATLSVSWRDRRRALLVAGAWAGLLLISAYLVLVLHRFPPRVYQPMFAAVTAIAALAGSTGGAPVRALGWIRTLVLLAMAVGLPGLVSTWSNRAELGSRLNADFRQALAQLPRDGLFVIWGATLPLEFTLPLSRMDELRGLHFYSLASDTRSPYNLAMLERFGVDDIHRAIYSRDDVFVISNDSLNMLLVRYVAEHYGEQIRFQPVARFSSQDWHLFSVYRFRPL